MPPAPDVISQCKSTLMVRFVPDQPGLTVKMDNEDFGLVYLGEYVVGLIDPWCPKGFMKVV